MYSINVLINSLGCSIVYHSVDSHYWGTLFVVFKPDTRSAQLQFGKKIVKNNVFRNIFEFSDRMIKTREYLKSFKGDKLFGYGASLQTPVTGYHMMYDFSDLECIIDDDERKNGKYFINLPIKIKNSSEVNVQDAVVFIMAHNFSRNIIAKLGDKPKRIILFNNGV